MVCVTAWTVILELMEFVQLVQMEKSTILLPVYANGESFVA
jgi:hypothetical protein